MCALGTGVQTVARTIADQGRDYFDQLQHASAVNGSEVTRDQAHAPIIESFAQRAKANAFVARANVPDLAVAGKQVYVQSIIAAYRKIGRASCRARVCQYV